IIAVLGSKGDNISVLECRHYYHLHRSPPSLTHYHHLHATSQPPSPPRPPHLVTTYFAAITRAAITNTIVTNIILSPSPPPIAAPPSPPSHKKWVRLKVLNTTKGALGFGSAPQRVELANYLYEKLHTIPGVESVNYLYEKLHTILDVRIYGRAQRRPVMSFNFRETPIKAVTEDLDVNAIYFGNGSGDLASVDIRIDSEGAGFF
nr:WD repeat-containing protein [Tanacetum cinerariifolium]